MNGSPNPEYTTFDITSIENRSSNHFTRGLGMYPFSYHPSQSLPLTFWEVLFNVEGDRFLSSSLDYYSNVLTYYYIANSNRELFPLCPLYKLLLDWASNLV